MAEKKKGSKLQSMEIHPHDKEGFSVVHHAKQEDRGAYTEPKTHIMKTHGELIQHVHDHMKDSGAPTAGEESDCPMCGEDKEDDSGDKE